VRYSEALEARRSSAPIRSSGCALAKTAEWLTDGCQESLQDEKVGEASFLRISNLSDWHDDCHMCGTSPTPRRHFQ
jgi:hypothetical protein